MAILPPVTRRNDVSRNELKLRQLDRRDLALKFYLAIISTAAVVMVLGVAVSNRRNLLEIENLICDVIIQRPAAQVSDGQREVCKDKGTKK